MRFWCRRSPVRRERDMAQLNSPLLTDFARGYRARAGQGRDVASGLGGRECGTGVIGRQLSR